MMFVRQFVSGFQWQSLPPEATAGTTIAVVGDWHGNHKAISNVLFRIADERPDVRVVHQVGDYGLWPGRDGHKLNQLVQRLTLRLGLTVLCTPGNHDWYDRLDELWASDMTRAVQPRGWTGAWFLPRGFRWTHAGRDMVSLGGAASTDRHWRKPGKEWWPQERIGDADMVRTIIGGPADVMFSHESPYPGTSGVAQRADLRVPTPRSERYWIHQTRQRLTYAWEAVSPRILFHGHYHVADREELDDGRLIESLGMEDRGGSIAYLDLATLTVTRA